MAWGWCLMPDHVHLIVAPCDEDGLEVTQQIPIPVRYHEEVEFVRYFR